MPLAMQTPSTHHMLKKEVEHKAEEVLSTSLENKKKEVDFELPLDFQISENEESGSNGPAIFQVIEKEKNNTIDFQRNGIEENGSPNPGMKEEEEKTASFQEIEKEENGSVNFQPKEEEDCKENKEETKKGSIFIQKNEKETDKEKWIKHYSSKHHILLVGEGDFSFSACLARAFGSATNMVATSLDSKGMLKSKYLSAQSNVKELEKVGCMVLHEVDVHTMAEHSILKNKKFDRIVFNFPHAGFFYREHEDCQIRLHKWVVKGFFKSARTMLRDKGEVHVTHKTTYPFNGWEVEDLGKEQGLSLIERAFFDKYHYPGYDNKRGHGQRSNDTFPVGECRTFKFLLGLGI